ncbi:MAG: Rad52/Rad22 family DNA repair protein [Planctomycetia bacterium]|nr:Rad52/Rad22 family DNA repair protein [Planctomycetia bacterium]
MNADSIMPRDPNLKTLTAALAAPFEPKDVKFKPQMVKNNRCLAMAYIDARLIQDRLDEVLGVENWEDGYKILPDGSVMCRLKLKLGDRWITKTDVGSPSEQPDVGDRLKAAFSDALKRAAVKFGIGRYLYRLPAQWVNYDPVKKQIAEVPQLPAFAIPKPKATKPAVVPNVEPKKENAKEPAAGFVVVKPESQKVEQPKVEQPKSEAQKSPANLPANGQELHRRLREYDAKLASQKLCAAGALLAHVTQAGIKAGYTANMNDWTGPAIPLAVDAVKEFEQNMRQAKSEPRTAA